MAKFLTTSRITASIEDIIKTARKDLFLISPYLKVNPRIQDILADKDREERAKLNVSSGGVFDRVKTLLDPKNSVSVDIRVVYGKEDLRPNQRKWLESLTSIKTIFRKNLHAMCYLNEDLAIVTSMNLHEFSQQTNDEMGVLVSRREEPELYKQIRQEVERIAKGSQDAPVTVDPVKGTPPITPPTLDAPETGFCIQCGTGLPPNPAKPYCKRCYRRWDKDENCKESHCHTCGKEHETTMNKPVCLACYRKYKDVLEFTAA